MENVNFVCSQNINFYGKNITNLINTMGTLHYDMKKKWLTGFRCGRTSINRAERSGRRNEVNVV